MVAPLVGAWIEIVKNTSTQAISVSLLSWERGLKFYNSQPFAGPLSRSSRGSVD